jgi:hypothetical protein
VRKELRPTLDHGNCDVCGRSILKGERTDVYLAPGGQRKLVCELCTDRAYQEGWIRESAHAELPASMRQAEPRRSLLARFRRRRAEAEAPEPVADEEGPPPEGLEPPAEDAPAPADEWAEPPSWEHQLPADVAPHEQVTPVPTPPPPRRRDARHVRAVPTNAQVKVERGIEIFNASEHRRTIAGIAKTLGEPWVSARPLAETPSEVELTVAWELSWYRFRVDLGDADDPVTLRDKGDELDQLEEPAREWNATAQPDGAILIGVRSEQ